MQYVAAIAFRLAAAADVTLLDDMAVLLAFLWMGCDRNEQKMGRGEREKATLTTVVSAVSLLIKTFGSTLLSSTYLHVTLLM